MAVNLTPARAQDLLPIPGVTLFTAQAGIKKPQHNDVTVMKLDAGAEVAAVFTQNRFCAAPVVLGRERLQGPNAIRALVINTGNANAGTGQAGRDAAEAVCAALAQQLACGVKQVIPFSTGVILEPLPADKIIAALPMLQSADWATAARAIMTTDTLPKAASRRITLNNAAISLTGIAKGAGMIHPNMATMLGFIATDAPVTREALQQLVKEVADESFNCITVDGDTSTNDSFVLIATGHADGAPVTLNSEAYGHLKAALIDLALELAQAIVRDGEGATKFITVRVSDAKSRDEARQVAYAIAHSPLIKTAFFASDPNLGRILCAIGYAGIEDLDVARIKVHLGDVLVAENGGRAASYTEEQGQRVMQPAEIAITVNLGRGQEKGVVYTCDFSYDYVKINADYRS